MEVEAIKDENGLGRILRLTAQNEKDATRLRKICRLGTAAKGDFGIFKPMHGNDCVLTLRMGQLTIRKGVD